MSITFFEWLFAASSIAMLFLFLWRSRGPRSEDLDFEVSKAGLADIAARLKCGEINEAEADAARLALLSRLRPSRSAFGQNLQTTPQMLFVAAAVFLLVSGIGAASSYVGSAPEAAGPEETISFSGPDGEMLARLTDYARSIGTEQPSSMTSAGELLPDVNAMIERLAARLETKPQDIEGWRTLGWSYFHTARYEQAATAFARALELDPGSAELKLSYEEAKAKAPGSDSLKVAPSAQTGTIGKGADGLSVEKTATPEAMPVRELTLRSGRWSMAWHNAWKVPRGTPTAGFTLSDQELCLERKRLAVTAFRKALEVFVDDSAASGKITAAAIDLGLKAE